ncbi:MAG: response regulator [Chthoniobacterales bacterium]
MHVLIADGDKGVGTSLSVLVERCGHEVVQVVGSGWEAIQAYTRLKPDAVLMDYSMPRLNGLTAARMILSRAPAAKIILVTGAAPVSQLADTTLVAVLSKPIQFDKLYGALYDAAPRR